MSLPSTPHTPKRRFSAAPVAVAATQQWFDPLLSLIVSGRALLPLSKGQMLYSQGQKADAVFFLETGKVKLTVVSKAGKEALLGIVPPGGFCGEGCLAGQALRVGSAEAVTPGTCIRVQKSALVKALHEQHPLSEAFLAQLLTRNILFEEDICDQLFNHSEKRLARALLKLARFGQEASDPQGHLISPNISQESLAEMVGTTRSRVNFFMNKFRRLGLIDYNGEVRVHAELLTDIVLND
ncbi:MAG TPA: Crp/Fnr family transcriptional regulator [Terriglobales bacterium]|jgi:CRP-like cAMP-binding protein